MNSKFHSMALGGLSLKLAQRHMIHKAIVIAMLATAGGGLEAALQFDTADNAGYVFFFPTGALVSSGAHPAETGVSFNPGTLTVTVTQTPEPLAAPLALSGVLGLWGRLTKRTRSTTV